MACFFIDIYNSFELVLISYARGIFVLMLSGDRKRFNTAELMNDFNCSCPIYIACGYTDLCCGIDGLASMIALSVGVPTRDIDRSML